MSKNPLTIQREQRTIAVIGGGYAGLAFGALMAKAGHKVLLFEAHTYLGGCASYFKRKNFTYDSGATTLSGLGPGRPLNILNKLLDLSLEATKLENPMALHLSDGKIVTRPASLVDWIETLEKEFPGHNHRKFWHDLKKREEDLWAILAQGQYFPPRSLKDFLKLINPELIKRSSLGMWAFVPFIQTLPKSMSEDKLLLELINEQLLISTQSHAHEVPALLAAMGLIYPDDMYYTTGGITTYAHRLAQIIEDNGGEIFKRHRVSEIEIIPGGFIVKGQAPAKKSFEFKTELAVSNLTVWDTPKLFNKRERILFKTQGERGAWAALTAYFSFKAESPASPLYHQIHYNHPKFGKGSFFFSFSMAQDNQRAPQGWQTVTVSTHTRPKSWPSKEHRPEAYQNLKEEYANWIEEIFKEKFQENNIKEMTKIEIGSPQTFERFTSRRDGLVGGLPHNLKNNIFTFPSQETPIKNFYQIGDTTFPGQGIVGVITGALMLAGKINNTNYLLK